MSSNIISGFEKSGIWPLSLSVVVNRVKSISVDVPPPNDNLLNLYKEYERGFSDEDAAIDFYQKLDILYVKRDADKKYAETFAKWRILEQQQTISLISRIKHPELYKNKMTQLRKGRGKAKLINKNPVATDEQLRAEMNTIKN